MSVYLVGLGGRCPHPQLTWGGQKGAPRQNKMSKAQRSKIQNGAIKFPTPTLLQDDTASPRLTTKTEPQIYVAKRDISSGTFAPFS